MTIFDPFIPKKAARRQTAGGFFILLGALLLFWGCGGGGGGSSSGSASGPPPAATVHPENWAVDHGPSFVSAPAPCLPCHGTDLRGGTSKVSCFLGSGFGTYCHVNGPPKPPHAIPLASPALHGLSAKDNLTFCQACHGIPGTISFDGGSSVVACDSCHTAAKAHPTDWHGQGAYSHRTSGNRDTACAICHNMTATAGFGPDNRSPSCFSASFTNAAGLTRGCHAQGPGTLSPHAVPFRDPALHGSPAKADLKFCQTCHGTPGSIQFNGGSTSTACASCHTAAKAHPTDWQGAGTYSHRTSGNRDLACSICHNVTAATPAGPDPKAPSCFSASFTNGLGQARACHPGGPGLVAPHAIPFTSPASHGRLAKADVSYCQTCHGTPGTILFAGGAAPTACSACHTAAKAHPTDWQGQGTYTHRNSGNRRVACAICHNVTAATPAGPDSRAPSCYSGTFTNAGGQSRSCHSGGP
jgi:uncharacterized CHY-type Zn-finger protein